MRAGRPRSQAMPSRRCGGGCLAGDFSESRPAPFGKLPFARNPSPGPPRRSGSYESETGFVSGKSGPRPPRRGGSFESETGFVSDKWGPWKSRVKQSEMFRDLGIPSRPPQRGPSSFIREWKPFFCFRQVALRPPRRGGSFESETGFVSDKSGPPTLAGGSFESETTGPYTYREQGPCPANSVCSIIEHRHTG